MDEHYEAWRREHMMQVYLGDALSHDQRAHSLEGTMNSAYRDAHQRLAAAARTLLDGVQREHLAAKNGG